MTTFSSWIFFSSEVNSLIKSNAQIFFLLCLTYLQKLKKQLLGIL
jgi:hypothetical protein